jgi:hypothetical protein
VTRLPDEYIDAARMRANRFAACWDQGTSGSLAADVRRLLLERESMMLEIEQLRRPTPPRVVGFAGYAGAGKNAAAEAITSTVLGFADPLYAGLATMLGCDESALRDRATKELPLPLGRSPRHLLQTLGTEWGRELVRGDLWIWRARERFHEAARLGAEVVAFSDVRFANELAFIRQELGGQVWWVERPGVVGGSHASEHSLTADQCDRVISNVGSRDQLTWAVRAAWREATAAAA